MRNMNYKRAARRAVESYRRSISDGLDHDVGSSDPETDKMAVLLDCVEQSVLDWSIGVFRGNYNSIHMKEHSIAGLVRPVWNLSCDAVGFPRNAYKEGAGGPSTDFIVDWVSDKYHEKHG